jgi:tetratricopeptide (TPR) repeat protein
MRWREASILSREAVERLLPESGRYRDVVLARLCPQLQETLFETRANAARALELAVARSDELAAALAHAMLARGNFTAERAAHVEAARAGFQRAGDAVGLAELLVGQGGASILAGLQAHAASLLEEARERFERLADADGLALVYVRRGRLSLHRGELAAADADLQSARRLLAASGGGSALPVLLEVEAELARVVGGPEQAVAAMKAYLSELGGRMNDASYGDLVLRSGFHLRFGPPDRLLDMAGRWASHRATLGGNLTHRMLASLCLAIAHARLGAPERAHAPLALTIRLARPLTVPRMVAAIACAAATVAAARGEVGPARRLLDLALRHPSLEYEWRLDAEALRAALAEGGPVGGADDDGAPPDDAAILHEIEDWMAGWGDAGEGVAR